MDYVHRYSNLHIAGRGGLFAYYNMDHAMASGLEAADRVIEQQGAMGKDVCSRRAAVGA